MEYVGIQTQKSRNDFRSMLLLFMFPCLVTGMVYLFCLALAWLGLMDGTMAEEAAAEGSLWYHANSAFLQSAPYAFGGVLIWFIIAYFFNTLIIKASTGAKSLERKDGKRVYNAEDKHHI